MVKHVLICAVRSSVKLQFIIKPATVSAGETSVGRC